MTSNIFKGGKLMPGQRDIAIGYAVEEGHVSHIRSKFKDLSIQRVKLSECQGREQREGITVSIISLLQKRNTRPRV